MSTSNLLVNNKLQSKSAFVGTKRLSVLNKIRSNIERINKESVITSVKVINYNENAK